MKNPINRDDVPLEVLAKMQVLFPGKKIICAGDIPGELPPEVRCQIDKLAAAASDSIANGTCIDCGRQMPGYSKKESDRERFKPAKGWGLFLDVGSGEPIGWQCPECDAEELAHEGEPIQIEDLDV